MCKTAKWFISHCRNIPVLQRRIVNPGHEPPPLIRLPSCIVCVLCALLTGSPLYMDIMSSTESYVTVLPVALSSGTPTNFWPNDVINPYNLSCCPRCPMPETGPVISGPTLPIFHEDYNGVLTKVC